MARPFTVEMAAAWKRGAAIALFVRIEHPSGVAHFWSGVGNKVWNNNTWTGAGILQRIEPITRNSELAIQEVTFSLTGTDPAVAATLSDNVRDLGAQVWLACIDDRGNVVPNPYQLIDALLDYQSFDISAEGTATISVIGRTGFYTLERSQDEAWTPEDQKQLYPLDTGLDFVPTLERQDIIWTPT